MKEPMLIERAEAQRLVDGLKRLPYEAVHQLIPILLRLKPAEDLPTGEEAEEQADT